MPGPFDRFNDRAKRVLAIAQDEAIRLNHNYIGTEHLLAGVVRCGDPVTGRVLSSLGVELSKVRTAIEFIIGRGNDPTSPSEITLSPRTKKVIELAIDESRKLGHGEVGPADVLLGLVREGEGIAAGILQSLGVELEKLRRLLIEELGRSGGAPRPEPEVVAAFSRGPFDGFTDDARRALAIAENVARENGHTQLGAEHILYGIAELEHGVASDVLRALGAEAPRLLSALLKARGARTADPKGSVFPGDAAAAVVQRARLLADRFGGTRIGPEHLLIEVVREPGGTATAVLAEAGIDRARLGVELLKRLGLNDLPG